MRSPPIYEMPTPSETPWYVKAIMPVLVTAALGLAATNFTRALANENRMTKAEATAIAVDKEQGRIQAKLDTQLERNAEVLRRIEERLARIEGRLDYQFGPPYDSHQRR